MKKCLSVCLLIIALLGAVSASADCSICSLSASNPEVGWWYIAYVCRETFPDEVGRSGCQGGEGVWQRHAPNDQELGALEYCTFSGDTCQVSGGGSGGGWGCDPCDNGDNCGGVCSPLTVDMDGHGRPTFTASASVLFDLDADGTPELRTWPTGQTAFLALDVNVNGRIDDGTELFGNQRGAAANGFDALAKHDANGDRWIDAADPVFPRLLFWRDANGNGQSEAGELTPVTAHGVEAFSLRYHYTAQRVPGAALRYQAVYYKGGRAQTYWDAYLASSQYAGPNGGKP